MIALYVLGFAFAVLAAVEAFAIDILNNKNADLKEKLWNMSGLEPIYMDEEWEIYDGDVTQT